MTAAVGLGPVVYYAATNAPALGAMTWSDDFNGAAGSAPDAGKWTHEMGSGGYGNQELEDYTNSTNMPPSTEMATLSSPLARKRRPVRAAGTAPASTHRRG